MATEVNQTFFAWSGETTDMGLSQGAPVSQKLNHGSISFGRFELESLSWEKWSVFTNDSRSEEFGKFNGLVAQKKAYFEEYYKRIRELKASQQQIQQTELTLEYSGDGSDSSQTGEEMQAEDLETPTASGTIVYDDYVEEATHETTSEQGMQCYHDHKDEDFHMEFSPSNVTSAARISQQTNKDTRENAGGDNSDPVDTENASCGHASLGAAYGNAKAPKRIIDKDPRLRYASMIIPKSVKTIPGSPLDRTSVSKRPASVKHSMTMNQKTKTDKLRSTNVTPQKAAGAARTRKPTAKEAPEVTGVRRPSSASARMPSVGERHPITRESVKKPADVSTPRRPSSAERHPVTRESTQKQVTVTTPCRPSTSERRPVSRGSAAKHADVTTTRRPSTGERRPITRDSVQKMDPRTSSKTRSSMDYPMLTATSVSIVKKAATSSATKSTKPEPKSNVRRSKGSSTLDSNLTRPRRMALQVSSSVNFPPSKMLSSSVGEPTFARLKKKEGIQGTVQSRVSASKKATPWQPGNTKPRAPNPPTPPPPPRRASRTASKPNTGDSSIGGRKPKASTQQWH
ncbi:protein WVD2-like 7 [Lolium rigidum]|uniref:protein WVD2-like 7 n=1 Tax=Lolium rigidum TaxID=89674 RepID=UPI001F5D0975|nr:protein WVD2-like 7 [Lolium rigidum]